MFSRGVQKGLVYALQYSLGQADGAADGVFGPTTRNLLRSGGQVSSGSTDVGTKHLVRLFKAGLIFNSYVNVDWDSTTFTGTTASVTKGFQSFCHLPTTGQGDYATWCSLLSSTGDPQRPASGADCMTPLNQDRINTLKSNSVEIVGRYIAGGVNKRMTKMEASLIVQNGLRFFPIYQENNDAPQYFTYASGVQQGTAAIQNAQALTIPLGAIIYFCCDWDPNTDEIDSIVLPFFRGVSSAITSAGSPYRIGVYGTRNLCQRISSAGIGVTSFVGGMSSGWSGNLGFPLPGNWAFDQIAGATLGSGAGRLEIDRDVVSGRDKGVAALEVPIDPAKDYFDWLLLLEDRANQWRATGATTKPAPWLAAEYIRSLRAGYTAIEFNILCGFIDEGFVAFATVPETPGVVDPLLSRTIDLPHFGAVLCACFNQPFPQYRVDPGLHDFGGWAGDLISLAGLVFTQLTDKSEAAGYNKAMELLGRDDGISPFSVQDMIADVDAEVAYWTIQANPTRSISDCLRSAYRDEAASASKYHAFIDLRFGSKNALERSAQLTLEKGGDFLFTGARATWWELKYRGTVAPFGVARDSAPALFQGVARAFSDKMLQVAGY